METGTRCAASQVSAMERIKDALEQARRAREIAIRNSPESGRMAMSTADVNALIDARRIRERVPFNQLAESEQDALIAVGEVIRYESGARVFSVGDVDQHLHFLLEGAVSIGSETTQMQTLYAYQEAALLPLDEAGVKSHSVTAVIPSRIFRIAQANLQGTPIVPPTVPPSEEISRDLYTHTYSGEQLAQLVDQLHEDRNRLAADGDPARPAQPLGDVRFGEDTMRLKLDTAPPSLEATLAPTLDSESATVVRAEPMPAATPEQSPPVLSALPSHDEISDEISRFTRELEGRFRRYVEQVRAEERRRAQARLQVHAKRLQALAEQQLRAKIETVRERYQAAYVDREKKLRVRYEHLIAMANKVTRQKAAIYQARRQLEDKLRLAEQVHNELAQIGLTVTRQLNDLEGMIPDESPAQE